MKLREYFKYNGCIWVFHKDTTTFELYDSAEVYAYHPGWLDKEVQKEVHIDIIDL